MFDRIVECFDPNDNARLPGSYPYGLIYSLCRRHKTKFWFRIRERTIAEKDFDLSCVKDFDMTIQLREVSLFLPQYGIYQE